MLATKTTRADVEQGPNRYCNLLHHLCASCQQAGKIVSPPLPCSRPGAGQKAGAIGSPAPHALAEGVDARGSVDGTATIPFCPL